MRHILFILAATLFFFTCSFAQESGWEGNSADLSHGQLKIWSLKMGPLSFIWEV